MRKVLLIMALLAAALVAAPPMATVGAPATQVPGVCGDQNDDGAVDVLDAVTQMQLVVGLAQPTQVQTTLGDLNRDGAINVTDVVSTLQHIVGLTTITECGVPAGPKPPPNPIDVAPKLDLGVPTALSTAIEFLYTGTDPIQTGVAPGTIEATRVAVLRGLVTSRDGDPLPVVTITVLDHPEFGQTLSRDDGMFDLAVNGGSLLTLRYEKEGFLPAQRQVEVPWQDYLFLPDVVLIPMDSQVTTVDLAAAVEMQVAQGSEVTDDDGTRQATLLFPQGTTAQMVLPDGSTRCPSPP